MFSAKQFAGGAQQAIAVFEIVPVQAHRQPQFFARSVAGTALQIVGDPSFREHLIGLNGYNPDPVEGDFTGWALGVRISSTPRFERQLGEQPTLVRY